MMVSRAVKGAKELKGKADMIFDRLENISQAKERCEKELENLVRRVLEAIIEGKLAVKDGVRIFQYFVKFSLQKELENVIMGGSSILDDPSIPKSQKLRTVKDLLRKLKS